MLEGETARKDAVIETGGSLLETQNTLNGYTLAIREIEIDPCVPPHAR
jgi:hypothetical protein